MKFCPLCNWRIARERAKMLNLWSLTIQQPKHVVLTQRNFETLTREKIRGFQKAFAKLRRTALWKPVKGGCISIEITNENRGWHLHGHILADVRWLDAGQLAITWGNLVGQEFGIVKVKDARGKGYLGEITKYVVKGAQLASWEPEKIAQFIGAIKGIRFFAPFGSLFGMGAQIKKKLAAMKPEKPKCKCGCEDFKFESETSSILGEIRREAKRR